MNFLNYRIITLIILFSGIRVSMAQKEDALFSDSGWSIHFQFTGIIQSHPSFKSPYSGMNSLLAEGEKAFSVTSTLFLGKKLWTGGSLYFNPELAGGNGVSHTLGIAGFTNGETFRIGSPEPVVYVGRLFLRQQIPLDREHMIDLEDDVNQVRERVSTTRLVLNLGKFGIADFFDRNNVSHDPRSDFMNWALMNNGAYDYAANTRGYTYGLVVEWVHPNWALRAGTALMPVYSNGPTLNTNYAKSNGETVEFEKDYSFHQRKGVVRLLFYYNTSKAPNYDSVVADKMNGTDTSMDVIYGKEYGGRKIGFGLNADQELGRMTRLFLRAGWNDGKTATWAFAEIDNTISTGIRFYGIGKGRTSDNISVAFLSNGISSGHRAFLQAGGYGFMIGDGQLPNYRRENIAEAFYQVILFPLIWASVDYQFVMNPAYNHDRGPVSVYSARVHVQF
jgi:high affinity Mn2+ porin